MYLHLHLHLHLHPNLHLHLHFDCAMLLLRLSATLHSKRSCAVCARLTSQGGTPATTHPHPHSVATIFDFDKIKAASAEILDRLNIMPKLTARTYWLENACSMVA
jgi:hypothetical protein